MKMQSISSVLVPASAIFFQFALWSSPVVRAAEPSPAQDESEHAVPADDDAGLFTEIEGGELRACSASNRVYIQFCYNDDGVGICRLRAGCNYSSAAYAECRQDFIAVCGRVPDTYVFY